MGKEHQVSQYADDTTLYIKQKHEYLAECLDTLEKKCTHFWIKDKRGKNKNHSDWGVKRQQPEIIQ